MGGFVASKETRVSDESFDGKVVLVTGSSMGIGEETARAFAARGARVVINSARSVEEGRAVAASIQGHYIQANIADPDAPRVLIDGTLAHYGRLDVLVNNAGTTKVIPHQDVDAATVDVWREIFDVNVFATWAVSVAALPALRETNGSIVNVSSVAGLRQTGSSIPYAASKAALNHLTALLAKVVGPNVRVNAVAPGLVDTPWTDDWDVVRGFVQQGAPLKRSGVPTDIAEVIVSLASSAYVTGQILAIDGGLSLVV